MTRRDTIAVIFISSGSQKKPTEAKELMGLFFSRQQLKINSKKSQLDEEERKKLNSGWTSKQLSVLLKLLPIN